MNWLTGGGDAGGGWEDDDELGDFSDQSLEEEEESGNEQQHQAASSSSSPPQQSGAVALGGGMFMGRLTRFLEAVTQPSSGEEEENEEFDDAGGEGEGWGDELDLDDEDIQMDDDPPPQDTPAAQPFAASALIPPDELVNSGWDDDLDLSFDPQPTEEQPGPEETTYLTMPLNDVNTEEEPIRNVSFGDLPDQSSSPGWEENDGLDEVMMEDDHHQHHQVVMDEETMPPPAPSRQISSLSSAAKTEVAVANSASSGWDKEDQDLDGLDDDDVDMGTETAAPAPQLVDHTPLPPPPPQAPGTTTSRVTTSSTLQTQSVSFAGASAIAVASASDIDDGWDDEDAIVLDQVDDVAVTPDESSHLAPTKILDHTPPPPPPPTSNDAASHAVSFAAMSTGAVAASTETGWDEDDGTLDELDVDGNADEEENNQMVDVTPPPPLPRRDSKATASAIAVTDENDGWDDDDDDDLDIDDDKEEAEVDSTPLVDHTPPPPPPPRSNPVIRDTMTDVAVMEADGEDDDISRDDTLSIANSRARYEEQQYQQLANQSNGPPLVDKVPLSLGNPISFKRTETSDAVRSGNSIGSSTIDDARPSGDTFASGSVDRSTPPPIVDHTPSVNPTLDRHASTEESMLVLGGGGNGNSSITESWDSLSDRVSEVRPRNRRMVDKTPMGRFHRGMPIDTSMAVAGQTSVGESLDSIDEVGEEPDSPARDTTSTPAIDAARWQPGEEYTINIDTATRSGITGLPGTIAEDDDDGMPLVDHTPLPLVKNNSTAASVDVLSVSSEEGDLGESMVGIDDVKEDLYGQVVDHTPATPNPSQRPKVGSAGLGDVAGVKQEDDTVVGVAENTDVEKDIRADDDMDDESSRGTKTTLEEYENRSLIGTVRLTIPEDEQLVDHVPPDRKMASADASTVVFADASTASSQVGDDIVNDDDDTSPAGFGPIVDHLPSVHIRSARSVATSIVTQTSGLDVDIKEDEDFDNTVGPGTSTVGGDEGSENEENSLPPMVSEEKHLVDHVPKRASRNPPIDGSMRVMVDQADDDMTQGVDTIAEDAAVDFGPIVDHTPFTARSGALTVGVSMTTLPPNPEDEADNTTNVGVSTDVDDGWDNEIPELEDISAGEGGPTMEETKEPAVVDHVPRRSFSHPADASTMVVVDPNDETSAVDYDDTAANNGAESNSRLFGPVVDHTPTPPISGTQRSVDASMQVMASTRNDDADDIEDGGTWFGASTVGGVSTVGASGEASTAGDDSSRGGWDDDGDVLDDLASPTTPARRFESNGSHLVDHVPQITLTGPTDVSIAVAVDPSVASSHEKEEEQDNIDVGPFGAVVDHTPSVARRESHLSVANSVATLATGITNDIKRDEEMDETTWNGGVSTQGDGWDQEEPELQALADAEEDQMPTLVDHVPERPESRPTDASTFVAGDASEIFSQVDDLGQDETYFGPVVDQTPHSQFSVHASAAGSTMVNVASVAEDDLDVAVEKAIDGEDPRTEAEEQTGWQETLPNPQSGNDDMSEDREQLVDYVPDEQEEEIPDIVHDGSSEMATVGEKSAALPADDPKEDEFGPVVDHLPILDELSHSPTISVTESNGDGRKKPSSTSPSSGPKNIDSVAANFSVESKESKDDGLEEDEFGPVVDHLPTSSSRASFTPSRGGSTVDALATVSEVEDDYVAGEGWEEDVDIDVSDQASPINSARPGDDRNLSVKWVDGLSGNNTTANSGGTSDSHFFDAEMGDSSRLPLNETRYYDPELGNVNAWGSLNLDADEDGDDTPPSTPRNSFESRQVLDIGESKQSALIANGAGNECRLCANSSTADCPCVKRLLAANEGKEGMIGSLKTPEGNTLKVNFDKLLETEMTKRRLVEKEFQALRATIESLKSSKDSLVLAGETQMDVLNKMKNSNSTLANDLEATKAETNELRAENRDFHAKNKTLGDQLAALEEEKRNLETECLSLKRDMEILQAKLTQVSSSASSDLSSRESELQSEISKWKGSNEELLHKIARFETECENLRGKNESLYEDLDSYRECVSKLEETNAAILSRESSLSVEMKHLKGSLQSQQQASVGSFQAQINSLQSEIAAKSGECAELKSQVASLQKKLTVSEADKFKHTKELARITKDRDATISEFEKRISKTKEEMENTLRTKDAAIAELKAKLSTESQMIQKLREEKAALENVKRTDAMVHQGAIAEKNRQISTIHNELKTTAAKIETLEKEKQRLSSSIEELRKQLAAEEAKSRQLLPISKERDSLKEALQQKNWAVAQMEAQIAQYDQKIEQSSSHWQQEVTMLQQERDRLVLELSSSSKEFEEVTQTLKKVQSEKARTDLLSSMVSEPSPVSLKHVQSPIKRPTIPPVRERQVVPAPSREVTQYVDTAQLAELFHEIQEENWAMVENILDRHPELSEQPDLKTGELALHKIARHGGAWTLLIDMVLVLYPKGLIHRDNMGALPIHHAAAHDNLSALEIVYSAYKEGINDTDKMGRLPIHVAANYDAVDAIKFLLTQSPEGAYTMVYRPPHNSGGGLPLHIACRNHASIGVITALLAENFASAKRADENGDLPLHLLLRCGEVVDPVVVKTLLTCFAGGLSRTDMNGDLPLHTAIKFQCTSSVITSLLTQYPEAAGIFNGDGHSALHLAFKHHADDRTIMGLLNHAPSLATQVDKATGMLPIQVATENEHSHFIVHNLLKRDMPIDTKEKVRAQLSPHHYSWNHIVANTEDMYHQVVTKVLQSCTQPQVLALAHIEGPDGKIALAAATPVCKHEMRVMLRLFNTLEVVNQRPAYTNPISDTQIFYALRYDPPPQSSGAFTVLHEEKNDGADDYIEEWDDASHISKTSIRSTLTSRSQQSIEDKLRHIRREKGQQVIAKLTSRSEIVERELKVRKDFHLSRHYVPAIISVHHTVQHAAYSEAMAEPGYCITMEGADTTAENLMLDMRRHGKPFPEKALKRIGISLLHMHEHGIIHGDFGTHNIGKFGSRWKLLGVGGSVPLGRPTDPNRGFYHPPEAIIVENKRNPIPKKSFAASVISIPAHTTYDIWAYGVVLYESMAGVPLGPYACRGKRAMSASEVCKIGLWDEATLRKALRHVPDNALARDLLKRLLHHDPSKRISSMRHVLEHPFFTNENVGGSGEGDRTSPTNTMASTPASNHSRSTNSGNRHSGPKSSNGHNQPHHFNAFADLPEVKQSNSSESLENRENGVKRRSVTATDETQGRRSSNDSVRSGRSFGGSLRKLRTFRKQHA